MFTMFHNVFSKIPLTRGNHLYYQFKTGKIFLCTSLTNYSNILKGKKEVIERTITEKDVETFSQVTNDFNSVHCNSDNKRGIVHGALLNGIVSGVIGTKLPGNGTIVISQTINFPKPCYIGETVIVSVEIEEARKIIICKYQVVNKLNGDILMEGKAKLVYKHSVLNNSNH